MITSELLRIRYSFSAKVLLLVVVAEAVGIGLLIVFLPSIIDGLAALNSVIPNATDADQLDAGQRAALTLASAGMQRMILDLLGSYGAGTGLPVIAALLFGALSLSTEYRRGSLVTSALAQPRRLPLLSAKSAALGVGALAATLLLVVLRGLVLACGLAVQHQPLLLGPAEIAGLWSTGAITLLLYTAIGFAVGLLLRNPVSVVLMLGVAITVEGVIRPLASLVFGTPNPALLLPFGLAPAISNAGLLAELGQTGPSTTGIGPAMAVFTLVIWMLLALGSGSFRFVRGDIPDRQ